MSNNSNPTMIWQQMDHAITGWVKAAIASPELMAILCLQALVVIVSLWALIKPSLASWFTLSSASLGKRFQPWRWVTYSFFHVNVPHLTLNMISLYNGAYYLMFERGIMYTTLIYVLGVGIPGILWCMFTSSKSEIQEIAGASAGIFALFGASAVVRPDLKLILGFIAPIDISTGVAVMMVISLWLYSKGYWKRVWHLGHFLGAMVGFYAAIFLG